MPDPDRLALALIAPQFLDVGVRVVGDQGVGGAQDARAATVILFQLDDLQVGVIARQQVEVFRLRTAPGVDALVIVADAGDRPARPGKLTQQAVLRTVGVLALIDQQVADTLAPGGGEIGIGLQQLQRQPDQVIEIDRVERA